MNLLNRIDRINRLWAMMLPHVPAPEPAWVGRWCVHPDKTIEHAIIRASKKFPSERQSTNAPTVWRYVAGVINNEARNITPGSDRRKEGIWTQ